MARRITQLIIIYLFGLLNASGSYEVLNFPQNTRSLSLYSASSAFQSAYLRNNPASLSLKSEGTVYSYINLPAFIHSGEFQQIRNTKGGVRAAKCSFLSYGSIIDSETNKKTTAFDLLIELGYKREWKKILSVGISGGFLYSDVAGYNSQLLVAKAGVRFRMFRKRMGLGLSLENAGVHLKTYTNLKEPIPTLIRFSQYYKPRYIPMIISYDLVRLINEKTHLFKTGLELNAADYLIIRVGGSSNRIGFMTGDFNSDILAGISVGLGFRFNKRTLDIGFMSLGPAGFAVGISIYNKVN